MAQDSSKIGTFFHTSAVVTTVAIGIGIVSSVFKLEATDKRLHRGIYAIEILILLIAFTFYVLILDRAHLPFKATLRLRYFDWLLTTPMMLLVLIILYSKPEDNDHDVTVSSVINQNVLVSWSAALSAAGMVLAGMYFSDKQSLRGRMPGFLIGFILLGWAFLHIGFARYDPDRPFSFWYTVVVWCLYGAVYLDQSESRRHIFYNCLDLIAKPLFAILIAYTQIVHNV